MQCLVSRIFKDNSKVCLIQTNGTNWTKKDAKQPSLPDRI